MAVLIDNRQSNTKISLKIVKKTAQAVLDALEFPEGELSVVFVDDREIEVLNKKYLNRNGPTNVIAFPMLEGSFSDVTPNLLGDVVISTDTAQKEGQIAGISQEERIFELLVHGILHLFGYDHELGGKEALEMDKKSQEMMAIIKSE